MFYQKIKRKVQCNICPHNCVLQEGKVGLCGVRQNLGGRIKCRTYGKISGYAFDPIEKKPLYHYYPGSKILSIGSYGCNLKCNFCQNWQISQACNIENLPDNSTNVNDIISEAKNEPNNIGIAFTYNEPTVWYEFMYDIAILAYEKSLKNVVVSNGFINQQPLEELVKYVDAFNIDLKSFSESFYREMTGSDLQPVLKALEIIKENGKHLEITNLVIPGKNDDIDVFIELIDWISNKLGADTILHISRYFPKYKQSLPYTPEETLNTLLKIATEKLNYVYVGNIANMDYSNTNCPQCNSVLIERNGYNIKFTNNYFQGNCDRCGVEIIRDT